MEILESRSPKIITGNVADLQCMAYFLKKKLLYLSTALGFD